MNYGQAMAEIKKGSRHGVYLIAGEEQYLAEKVMQALLEKLLPAGDLEGLQKINGDIGLEELLNLIDSAPFFADRNVILVRNSQLFKEKKNAAGAKTKPSKLEERFMATLSDMPPYSVVIFQLSEKADKRRKLYKVIEKHGLVVEADPIPVWGIGDWLQSKLLELGKSLDREAYAYLLEGIGMMQKISLGFLDQELGKLALYTERKQITKDDLLMVLSGLPEVSAFAMLDAVSDKNVAKALRLLREQLAAGTYPLQLAALLTRHVRQLWQAKTLEARGCRGRQLAGPLGLVPFIAEKVGQKSRNFSEAALKAAMLDLAEADYLFKSGYADASLLEKIIIELCQQRQA